MNAAPTPAAPASPRRRWPRVLAVLALLLVLLLALLPVLAAPFVRGVVVEQADANLNGSTRLDGLSFGWGGGLRVEGLAVDDLGGAPVLSLRELDADVDLLGALGGRYDATVRVAGLSLDVRREASGALNLETLSRAAGRAGPESPAPPELPAGGPGAPQALPDLRVDFELADARVTLHDGARRSVLEDLRLSLKLDGLDRPAPFELSARIVGPDGPGGALSLRGEVTPAAGGQAGAEGLRAHVELLLQDLLLAALEPASAVLGGPTTLRGTLRGEGRWDVRGPLSVDGRTELSLAGLHAAGGPLAAALDLPELRLSLQAQADADGSGEQHLELDAGEALALRWDGRARGLLTPQGALDGELALDARLAPLLGLAAGALPLRAGLTLDGAARVRLRPALDLRDGAPAGGSLALQAGLEGLSAHDDQGRALDLAELRDVDLVLAAAFDAAAGSLRLDELRLHAGPVTAGGHGSVAGLPRDGGAADPAALQVQDTALTLQADLDRLAALLGQVLDLGGLQPGGRLELDARLEGAGQRLAADTSLRATGLRAGGAGLADLPPLDLELRQRATLDLAPGGHSELQELSLETPFATLRARGDCTDLLDEARRAGSFAPELRLRPSAAATALAPLLGGLAPAGEDVTLSATLGLQGPALEAQLRLTAPSLDLAGLPGGEATGLRGLDLALDAALPDAQHLELRSLTLALAGGHAAGVDIPAASLVARGRLDRAAGTLELPELRLESSVVQGGGTLDLRGLLGVPALRADLDFGGEVEPLRALLAAFVPELAPARGAGRWSLALTAAGDGARSTLRPELRLSGVTLEGFAPGGSELPLREADVALTADLELDGQGAGALVARELTLEAPGLSLQARGGARGFLVPDGGAPDPAALQAEVSLDLALQPDLLQQRVGALLGGLVVAGEPLTARLGAGSRGGVHEATLALRGARLDLTLPAADGGAPRRLAQRELALDLDASADLAPGRGRVELRQVRLASSTARVELSGSLTGLDQPGREAADLTLALDAGLAPALSDLAGLLPPGLPALAGELSLRGALRGDQGRLALQADTTVRDLDATLPGDPPRRLQDPELRLGLAAGLALPAGDVEVTRGELSSTVAHGGFGGRLSGLAGDAPRAEGLELDLAFVPDRVAALLGGLLPVGLRGAEEERLVLRASGPLAGGDLRETLLALDAQAELGTGTLELPGLVLDGSARVEARGGSVTLGGDLAANGGRVTLDGALDLRRAAPGAPAPASRLGLKVDRVRAAGELGSALAAVNPLFAAAPGQVGEAAATVGAGLDLSWDGELPLEALLAGGRPELRALTGAASLGLTEVALAGSPLVADLLGRLGSGGSTRLELAPVQLALREGRVHYEEPWGLTLGGTATSFSGSVGLDGTLDLAWNVPIGESLAQKHKVLAKLQGQSLVVPLRGTLSGPRLRWDDALEDLAGKAVEAELKERLGGELGGLGGLLGGQAPEAPQDGQAPGKAPAADPVALLAQADALWAAGKPDEARPLYKRLKDDFKLTLTYLANKDRIDDRAKAKKKKD